MPIVFDPSALLGATSGLSGDLIAGWYSARASQASGSTATAALLAAQRKPQVIAPWDARLKQPTTDERLRSALGGAPIIDEKAAKLSDPNASEADHKLFALYNALAKLSAIANHAADKTTSGLMLGSLNRRFQSGLDEILAYTKQIESDEFAIVAGKKASKLDAGIHVPSGFTQYTTKPIHRADTTTALSGLNGTEQFTISVTKGGVTTDVAIDLSEMGTASIELDDLITFLNGKLQAAGMVSRFSRVRLETLDSKGKEKSPPPQVWGLQIQGTSTERLSFSAASAGTAVYLAGNSGKPGETTAQMIKLDASGASPTLMTSARIDAASTTASASSAPPTVTTDNTNPGVADVIANLNKILADATGNTTKEQTNPETSAAASAIDADGNVYLVGATEGSLDGAVLQGTRDVFLTKYDSTGQVVWQRMIGVEGETEGLAVAVDTSGNVVIAGKTNGDLDGGTNSGAYNSFVTKFDRYGQELFTRDVGPVADDAATSLAIGADGSVYYGGWTKGALAAGITAGGGSDGYITKLSSTGTLLYNRQFGGTADERLTGLAVDASGNLVALSMEDGHAILRSYDSSDGTSAALWSRDLGDLGGGEAAALTIDASTIHVGGSTSNSGIGGGTVQGSYQGGSDGFVVSIADTGTIGSTTYIGTGSTDRIQSIAVKNGEVYVAGDTTGDLGGGFTGTVNGFAAKLGAGGALDWVYQYAGRNGQARITSIAVDDQGSSVLDVLGLPKGRLDYIEARTVTAQSTVRPGQEFFISVNGGAKRRITIGNDDTLNALSLKINAILLLDGKASVYSVKGGTSLRIKGNGTSRIDLIAGADGKDALKGLGLAEGTIVADPLLANTSSGSKKEADEDKGPRYIGLGLSSDLKISTREDAGHVNGLLQTALAAIRKAFRDLNPDPTIAALSKLPNASGPVPEHISRQLANYQNGLFRLLSGGGSVV